MSKDVAGFAPLMNWMCGFPTGSDTMYVNLKPVNHPDGEPRLSIALYYYTATWEKGPDRPKHRLQATPRLGGRQKLRGRHAGGA
jgi:hypothetical protein